MINTDWLPWISLAVFLLVVFSQCRRHGRGIWIRFAITAAAFGFAFWRNAADWLDPTLDFSGMSPRSAGSSEERWSLACIALEGPFAWAGPFLHIESDWPCLLAAAVLILAASAQLWWPRQRWLVIFGILAAVAWIAIGFFRSQLRIT